MDEIEAYGNRFKIFSWSVFDAASYVLTEDRDALIFDAVDSDEMISFLKNAGIENVSLFLTHEHFDHILGVEKLKAEFNCKIAASIECGKRIRSPKTNLSSIADALVSMHSHSAIARLIPEFSVSGDVETFDGYAELVWHEHIINCHCLKGHSPGSVCYIFDEKMMFSGDELLPIPVITRLPGGSTRKYWEEDMPWFERIKDTVSLVFPGHGQPGAPEDMIRVNIIPDKYRQSEN